MSTELIKFDDKQLDIIKTTIAKGTTDEQFALFIQVCQMTGLNPFARQIYAVVRNTKKREKVNGVWQERWVPEMSIQTSIDGYRLLAQRSNEYQGQDGPYFLDGKTKEWLDYWIEDYPPVAARVGVLRKGFQKYLYAVAKFDSYVVRGYNEATKKYDGEPMNLWAKMPEVMISKVAEALALRRAFPAELSGIYTKEEMDQADMPLPDVSPTPPSVHVIQEQSSDPEQEAEPVESEVVESSPVPISTLRARVEEIKPTSRRGEVMVFERFYQAVAGKPYTSDDAISPDESVKLNRYLDDIARVRANKQQSA
jgi:phage recombination protein Bet